MAYNPNVLQDILQARSLTKEQLSQRLGVSLSQLNAELSREPEPRQSIINDISKELSVPSFVFLMENTPELHEALVDFRSETPRPRALSRQTIESIQFAAGIQRVAAESNSDGVASLPKYFTSGDKFTDAFALRCRDFFNISIEDQIQARDAREFYVVCRKKIEDKGIFVLHDSFPPEDGSGFCLAHPQHPIIVVNTKRQTRGRRLFTLLHELAHVIMGRSGISDPFVTKNTFERACNRFAGAFLVPQPFVLQLLGRASIASHPDVEDVKWASRRLKISQEATVLRLEQIGLYHQGSYAQWKRIVSNANPDYSERGGGPNVPPEQEKVKLSRFGFHFARVFSALLEEERLSATNIYRSTGLKPKYQRPYFDYVRSLSDTELRELDYE